MTREEFEQLVGEEFPNAVAERYRGAIKNVALLVDDEPSADVRAEEGLRQDETLLGLYRGIPATARGDIYGIGTTLPDTITLYQLPIEEEAAQLCREQPGQNLERCVRQVIRETIWHEVAHHFGFDEAHVREREAKRDQGV